MRSRKFLIWLTVVMVAAFVTWGGDLAWTQTPPKTDVNTTKLDLLIKSKNRITPSERKAAATNLATMKKALAGKASVQGAKPLLTDPTTGFMVPDYFGVANWANSPPLRKFIDRLPGLGASNANLLGQYIPVAVADTTTYPNSDYYEIAIVEYEEKMHTDLPATRLRGYVQLSTTVVPGEHVALTNVDGSPILKGDGSPAYGVTKPHFLGPVIVATGALPGEAGRPVRIKFYNLLPTGTGGDLFIPVDETVMGAGKAPNGEMFTQNRATIHLHGANTIWISDGTPHQWITPANETTSYPEGVSVYNVPDMANVNDPRDGAMTLFYTNAQSARLQFYHEHAVGITRLGVYTGVAAGYLITDAVESDLIDGTNNTGVNPGLLKVLPGLGIPLIVQDRTFVDATTVGATDPTWLDPLKTFGTGGPGIPKHGDLWFPHLYIPAQNPYDLSGANPFGRWMYGPWFYPPTVNVEVATVPNPYYDPINAPWEPPEMPGTPNPSMPGEAFMDTAMVNGTPFPYVEVEPKAYRFRVLNAANDRMFNLQMYVAADKNSPTRFDTPGTTVLCDGAFAGPDTDCTEVKMIPVSGVDWLPPFDASGVPDPATKGPDWIQIGSEGGFLPAPAVIPSQPITWNTNPTAFNFGVVVNHSLLLGPAERADVVVDFSAYAGQTLILYNDAPAALPAPDPRYDYYTGAPDQTDTGGAPAIAPGVGPNIRTVMQIRVGTSVTTPTTDVTLPNLEAVWAKGIAPSTKRGVFEVSQDPIIIPQAAYNSAYGKTGVGADTFPTTAAEQYIQLNKHSKTFSPIDENGTVQAPVTMAIEPKAMHDEMGGVYDTMFGRMSGMLGLEMAATTSKIAQFIPYGYDSPPVEIIQGSVYGTQVGSLNDGTQIWNITHNGVDTHPIHVHLFNAQIINRVAWDGGMLPPDPNELGWKETFRVNPLEQIYIAIRPMLPTPAQVPFEIPNSIRLLNPSVAEGAELSPPPPAGWFTPDGTQMATPILNHYVNYGWEYVWHCHILAHEEMDMMHATAFAVPPKAPSGLTASRLGTSAVLNWTDNSMNSTGFTVERSTSADFTANLVTTQLGDVATYTDSTIQAGQPYFYRVSASNTVGDVATVGFPVRTVNSTFSNSATLSTDTVTISSVAYDSATQTLTVSATSNQQPTAQLTATGYGALGWKSWLNLYRATFTGVAAKPASVTVTSSAGGAATYTFPVETVTISSVVYDPTAQTLTVIASSNMQPSAQLAATGYGALGWKSWLNLYRSTFTGVAARPASVTVTSSGGGSATYTFPVETLTITSATYANGALTITATSSMQPNVALTATGYGALGWKNWLNLYRGTFTVPKPANVTVTSSGGGSATVPVP